MNQIQTQIAAVNGPQTTSTGRQFWVVVDSMGTEYRAWEAAHAQKAMALLGQPVLLSYLEKQNGNYLNRSFKDAAPSSAAPAPQPAATFSPQGVQHNPLPAPPALPTGPSDRDAQIIRQSAYKAAVDLAAPLVEAGIAIPTVMESVRSITDELVAYGLTGNWGGASTASAEPASVPAAADAAPWE